jgi:site-specific DNA recombinase
MPRIAIGYTRVSTQEQARDGVSLEAQSDRIKAHCKARELDLVACHEDRGMSGRRASNRTGLDAAIQEVSHHRGVLVVYSLSRLARSVRDCIDIASRLERAGAELVLLTENIDTNTATGRMFFHVIAALAQFESDLNGERVRAALDYTRQQGRRYCRNPPFGSEFRDGKIEPNECEQKLIRRIKRLRTKGWSYRRIERRFKATNVVNRRGNPFPFQAIAAIDKQVVDGNIRRPARRRRRGQ